MVQKDLKARMFCGMRGTKGPDAEIGDRQYAPHFPLKLKKEMSNTAEEIFLKPCLRGNRCQLTVATLRCHNRFSMQIMAYDVNGEEIFKI